MTKYLFLGKEKDEYALFIEKKDSTELYNFKTFGELVNAIKKIWKVNDVE